MQNSLPNDGIRRFSGSPDNIDTLPTPSHMVTPLSALEDEQRALASQVEIVVGQGLHNDTPGRKKS